MTENTSYIVKASAHCIWDKTSKACEKEKQKDKLYTFWNTPGRLAQVSLIADAGVVSSIPTQPHTFVEIYHEILSMVILLLQRIQEGLLSVTSKSMCTAWVPTKKVWLG